MKGIILSYSLKGSVLQNIKSDVKDWTCVNFIDLDYEISERLKISPNIRVFYTLLHFG